ncbi:hypothetical protein M3912_000932 [Vibrio metschnikovii]|nr:hypothetical protein [Vibrio metschnikovii]
MNRESNSNISIINLANVYEIKFKIYLEMNDGTFQFLTQPQDHKFLKSCSNESLLNIYKCHSSRIDELRETFMLEYLHNYLDDYELKRLIMMPMARRSMRILDLNKKLIKIKIEDIILKFSEKKLNLDKTEGLITLAIFLGRNAELNNMGVGITQIDLASQLKMSTRRVSSLLKILEELNYIKIHSLKEKNINLGTFIELKKSFWLTFTDEFEDKYNFKEGSSKEERYYEHLNKIKNDIIEKPTPTYIIRNVDEFKNYKKRSYDIRLGLQKLARSGDYPQVVLNHIYTII